MQEKRQTAMKTGFDFAFACDKNVHFWLTKDIYQEMLTTSFSRVLVSSVFTICMLLLQYFTFSIRKDSKWWNRVITPFNVQFCEPFSLQSSEQGYLTTRSNT